MPTLRKFVLLFAILTLAVWFVACSDDSPTDPGGGGDPDTTPPQVVSTRPYNTEANVSLDDSVYVVFNEAMDPASADGQLTLSSGANMGYTWNTNRILAIGHDDWAEATQVTCTLGTGLTDAAGNALPAAYSFAFWTLSSTELLLLDHAPADGATGVNRSQSVMLQFSESVQGMEVANLVTITDATPTKAAYDFDVSSIEDGQFLLTPEAPLPANTVMTVTVPAGFQAYSGRELAETVTFSYTTGTEVDTTPPTIVSFEPANGTTDMSPDLGYLRVTFSEPINPDSFYPHEMNLGFYNLIRGWNVSPTWSADGTVMTLPLPSGLPAGTPLALTFTEFEDLSGNWQNDEFGYLVYVAGTADYFPVVDGTLYMDDVEWEQGGPIMKAPPQNYHSEYLKLEMQPDNSFRMAEYTNGLYDTPTGDWDAFKKTSGAVQWLGFEDVDEAPSKANMFASPLDILPLPFAVGSWTDNTTVTIPDDGTYRATINGQVLGKADYMIWESDGEVFIKDCWTVYREMTVEVQNGQTWDLAFTETDTVRFAPSLGEVNRVHREVDANDGSWYQEHVWRWIYTTEFMHKGRFERLEW